MHYYVGVDIAKYTHYASILTSDGEVIEKAFKFENNIDGFNFFLSKIKNLDKNKTLIGFESTGHYAENLSCFLFNLDYNLGIINPIQTAALRKTNIRKTKNDKIDSEVIAKSLILNGYTKVTGQHTYYSSLKSLAISRRNLVKDKSKAKTQLTSYIDRVFPELHLFFKSGIHLDVSYALLKEYSLSQDIQKLHLTKLTNILVNNSHGRYKKQDAIALKELAANSIGINNINFDFTIKTIIEKIEFLENQIKVIEQKAKVIIDSLNSPIMTIPGMSYIQATAILGCIGDIKRFSKPRQLVAFAGLDPSVNQSGEFTATNTRMSKRGSKLLRSALIWSAFNISNNNNTFHDYYIKKRSNGRGHYAALGHVATKLTRVIFKLLKDNISFNLP